MFFRGINNVRTIVSLYLKGGYNMDKFEAAFAKQIELFGSNALPNAPETGYKIVFMTYRLDSRRRKIFARSHGFQFWPVKSPQAKWL